MADLLLELFSEEIPARMQADAEGHLKTALASKLGQNATGFSTPRRLAVWIKDLPPVQPDVNIELKGPRVGAPQAAIDGFLKKSGMTLAQLIQQDGIYIAKSLQKGKPTAEIIKPLVEEILANFPWPKSMRWGSGDATWVRPLHSILCLFDGKIVPVEFAGIKAGNITYGHRFLAPAPIVIDTPTGYEAALEKAFVIADREKRKVEILKQANALCATGDWRLKTDDYLLEEVTGLVEWPTVLMGTIDANYMDLPPEVLISEMRAHQKYFALEDEKMRGCEDVKADASSSHRHISTTSHPLSNRFLLVSNMTASDGGKAIIGGNERVLRARLADGRFFWDSDRKKKLEDWAAGLASVTYHAKLGSVAQKVERIKKLALELAAYIPPPAGERLGGGHIRSAAANNAPLPSSPLQEEVMRAATLCKADLTTGMVGEFPELQGVMGRYYALAQGETPEVADAIRDHYKPQGPADSVPAAPVSICVALADKLDTLCSMFAIGEKPTGSKDPFALRRAALGVIRIILENKLRLPLKTFLDDAPLKDIALREAFAELVKKTEAKLHENPKDLKVGKYVTVNTSATHDITDDAASSLSAQLLAFFHDRLVVQLKDSGIRHDVIKAVIAHGDDDLVRISEKARAVQAFLETDDGKNLLAGYKRAANILAIEEKKDKKNYLSAELVANTLVTKEEQALALSLRETLIHIGAVMQREEYSAAMTALSALRSHVDVFFEKTMVNCEEQELRANRLRLLASIRDTMNGVADFRLIEG